MDVQKIAVKFFAADAPALRLEEFIPVFHRWIQERRVDGTLVDVADYSHLANGPGVMLVGHEADYSMDAAEGPLGLLYSRKMALDGPPADRIRAAFRSAQEACAKLEEDLKGRIQFDTRKALVILNDRLGAPNSEETMAAFRPPLESALAAVYPGAKPAVWRDVADPRRRFAVHVQAGGGA